MSNLKGAMVGLLIFVGMIAPILLETLVGSVYQNGFMKVTTEFTEQVKEEGGITNKVNQSLDIVKSKGYEIVFHGENGATVTGKKFMGDEISISYSYPYQGVREIQVLETTNQLFVRNR